LVLKQRKRLGLYLVSGFALLAGLILILTATMGATPTRAAEAPSTPMSSITMDILGAGTVVVDQTNTSNTYMLKTDHIYKFEVWGAQGGNGAGENGGAGGKGSYAVGWYDMREQSAQTVTWFAGRQPSDNSAGISNLTSSPTQYGGIAGGSISDEGYDYADFAAGGGGGGASGIRLGTTELVVAGGGGGGGAGDLVSGGAGGGISGVSGTGVTFEQKNWQNVSFGMVQVVGGAGATGTAHGQGGTIITNSTNGEKRAGNPGTSSSGGMGFWVTQGRGIDFTRCGGGGGGGYTRGFSGGSGAAFTYSSGAPTPGTTSSTISAGGGGSGGTSYIGGVASISDSVATTSWEQRTGHGRVIITEYAITYSVALPPESGIGWTLIG